MEYKLPLLVNKLVPNAYLPTKGSPGAAGYDLYSIEECIVPAHGKYVVKTGISLSIPSGNYGRIGNGKDISVLHSFLAPRSGLALKNFIDTGAGVIDEDYRGEIGVVLFNYSANDFRISPGDRIAQLIIEKISDTNIIEVEELDDTQRGDRGFGSTGVTAETELNFEMSSEREVFNKEVVFMQQVNLNDDIEWREWAVLVLYSLHKSGRITYNERKQWLKLVFAGQKMIYDILKEYVQKENLDNLNVAFPDLKITN